MAGLGWDGPLDEVWAAAVSVTAAAFGVDRALVAGEPGRLPPAHVRWPRKVAIQVAVLVSDCDYQTLARGLGMHKTTVGEHCAQLRERQADDPRLEALSEHLTVLCWTMLEAQRILTACKRLALEAA